MNWKVSNRYQYSLEYPIIYKTSDHIQHFISRYYYVLFDLFGRGYIDKNYPQPAFKTYADVLEHENPIYSFINGAPPRVEEPCVILPTITMDVDRDPVMEQLLTQFLQSDRRWFGIYDNALDEPEGVEIIIFKNEEDLFYAKLMLP